VKLKLTANSGVNASLTLGGGDLPLPFPFSPAPLPSLPLPFPPYPSPPSPLLPLEVGPLNPAMGSGEALLAPPAGSGAGPSRNRIWCILALKPGIWWQLEAHIPLHCHQNIGGDIPIDVPTNQNICADPWHPRLG